MKQYRIDPSNGLEFGLYTLGDHLPNPQTGERISAQQRIHEIIELAQLAEQAGLDFLVSVRATRISSRPRRTQSCYRQLLRLLKNQNL